jgi:peptide/nickel transport system permease protein
VTRYIIYRLLHSLLVIFGVVTIVFVLARMTGDPAALLIPPDAGPDEAERVRKILGLDRPLWEQYVTYLSDLARGDLGTSFRQNQPALNIILQHLPATVSLAAASLFFAIATGMPVGIISALRKDSIWDRVGLFVVLIGQTAPPFWLGIISILIFSVYLQWFPVMGIGTPRHLVLPAVTLGAYSAAMIARIFRSSLIEVMREDYIRTAYSKGLNTPRVVLVHVLKNAAIPVVTIVGLQVGVLIGGSIITESVFNYPGMGYVAMRAIYGRDFPVLQAYVLMISLVVVVTNLSVDISYILLDPRVRYER